MSQNIPITADVYVNTQPAAQQLKAFSDKNLRNLRINLGVNDAGLRKASNGLGQIRNDADQFTKSMAAANARVLAFGTAVAVIETMRRSFLALIKTTVDVEHALAKISVVAGDDLQKAGISIAQLGKSIFNIARDTGQSFETVNEATLEFQRQGIGVQESLKRTRDAMIAVRISGVSVGDAVTGLTSVLNAFKKSGLDSTTALNKLVALDNSSAASLPDLFKGLQRAASISQLAGNNFDQTAASIAALQEITARGGPVIGNALKSIDTRLYSDKSLKFLSEFGGGIIKIKDDAGQLLPSIEIIRNLSNALKNVPKEEELGILTKLSGLYQVNSLAALVDSFKLVDGEISLYDKNLKTVTQASNEASAANKKLSTVLASQFNTINVNVGEFLNKLGEIGVKNPLSGVLDFLIKIQGTLQNIVEGSGPIDSLIQGVIKFAGGSLFSAPVLVGGAFILVKILKDFITFAATAFSVFTGINNKLKDEASLVSGINSKLRVNNGELDSAYGSEQRRLSIIKSANAEYSKQIALVSGITSASNGTRQRFVDKNLTEGAVNVRRSGGIVGDVSSYLPTIIGGKSDNLASKLGSEIRNNRPTVVQSQPLPAGLPYGQPNIPTGLKNNAGQFIPTGTISNALGLMINSWVFAGKQALEMGNLIRKEAGRFNLGQSFGAVSKAANDFAQGLIRDRNLLTAQARAAIPGSVNGLNTGGTGFTSSPQFSGLGFNRPATEVSKVGLGGFPNVTALPQFNSERLALKSATEQRLRIDTQNRIAGQQELAQKLKDRENEKTLKDRAETRRGEAQKRLNELKSSQSSTTVNGYGSVIPTQSAISSARSDVALNSRLANYAKSRLQQLDKTIYEQYGIAAGSSSKTVISESQKADQAALAQRLRSKFGGRVATGEPLLQGGGTLAGLQRSDGPLSTPPKSTGFNPEAFKNFAFTAVLATSAISGLANTFRGVSPTLDRFADLLYKASLALTGFIALNQIGGVNFGGASAKVGAGLAALIGGGGGLLAKAFTPLLAIGKGLVSFIPVIGQTALAFVLVNEAFRAFTGSSALEKLRLMFGGLTEEASKAKDRFNALASELFDSSGQYLGKTTAESRSANSASLNEARVTQQAKLSGVNINSKTPKEIAGELIKEQARGYLRSAKTGQKTTEASYDLNVSGEAPVFSVKTVDETLANFNESISPILEKNLLEVISKEKSSLIERLNAIGVRKINGVDLSILETEDLQKKYAQGFIKLLLQNKKEIERAFKVGRGNERVDALQKRYESIEPIALKSKFASADEGPNPEDQKKLFDFRKELLDSIYSGASAEVEGQIKSLEEKSSDPTLTLSARRELESQRNRLARLALDVGNVSANEQYANAKSLNQSQLDVNGKTQDDIDKENFILEQNLKNTNAQYQANIKLLKNQVSSADRANTSLDKLSKATDSAQAALSNLSVARAISNQRISGLESASNNPALDIFGREGFQRQANQEKINALRTNAVKEAKVQAELKRAPVKNLPLDEQVAANKEIDAALKEQLINIQTNINELESANQNIGAFSNASAQLTTSLEEFRRSIGQNRAQNQFNTLQATDSSSLTTGLISEQVFGQAEGKSGKELVSFLADQNAILNEQFKIRTALNATEKLDLETQLALTKEILDIKTQELDPLEKQQKIEEAINKNITLRRGASYGVKQARAGFDAEQQNFGATFAKNATDGFRDGLVNAIDAATSKTADLKSTLLGIAFDFANALKKQAVQNLVNVLLGSSKSDGGSSSGGLISSVIGGIAGYFSGGQKKAAGGMISGGSGTKDDVPTLLMGGEYVIPKSTVQQYGLGFFEGIRNGSIGKMAQGGFFAPGVQGQGAISGNRDLLDFATQTATSSSNDVTRSLGNGAAIAALEPESLRLSNFARFGDSPIVQATQEAKDQAFGLYLDGLNAEKEYAAQQAAIKKAKKDQLNGLWTALAVAAIGGAVSYGLNSYGSSAAAKKSTTSTSGGNTQRYYDGAGKLITSAASALSSNQSSAPAATSRDGYYNPYPSQSVSLPSNISSQPATRGIYSTGYNNPLFNGININGQYRGQYRNAGGYVGGNGDSIPTMLSNKEFVLNSSATQKLGDKNLYALNNGGTPSSGGGSDEKIIAKLDELIQKTIGASNVTVSVSMDSSGKDTSKDQSSSDNSQSNQKLSQRIKDTVVSILREEQRPGGVLSKR